MDTLIIGVRVSAYAMRGEDPNVPWTPDEIGRDARAAQEPGASIVHVPARRPDGSPAHGIDGRAAAIRANSGLLIDPALGQIPRSGTL